MSGGGYPFCYFFLYVVGVINLKKKVIYLLLSISNEIKSQIKVKKIYFLVSKVYGKVGLLFISHLFLKEILF